MCGIVGYVGNRSSVDVLLGGLKRLEYRGYDSAGVAVIDSNGTLDTRKHAGKLGVLSDDLAATPLTDGQTGIGHTRWATHGGPTDENAHPHLGDGGKLALIHNGIIENFSELKAELLESGHTFSSQTDSEVAALLVGDAFRESGDLTTAMLSVVNRLEGAFTLLYIYNAVFGDVFGRDLHDGGQISRSLVVSLNHFFQAILGAEYMLNMLPKGTHEYARFIRPNELTRWCRDAGLSVEKIEGMTYNPITRQYSLTPDCSVNYMLACRKLA